MNEVERLCGQKFFKSICKIFNQNHNKFYVTKSPLFYLQTLKVKKESDIENYINFFIKQTSTQIKFEDLMCNIPKTLEKLKFNDIQTNVLKIRFTEKIYDSIIFYSNLENSFIEMNSFIDLIPEYIFKHLDYPYVTSDSITDFILLNNLFKQYFIFNMNYSEFGYYFDKYQKGVTLKTLNAIWSKEIVQNRNINVLATENSLFNVQLMSILYFERFNTIFERETANTIEWSNDKSTTFVSNPKYTIKVDSSTLPNAHNII